jgi:hypothetical protein
MMSHIFSIAMQFWPSSIGARWSLMMEVTGPLNSVRPKPHVPSSAVTRQPVRVQFPLPGAVWAFENSG